MSENQNEIVQLPSGVINQIAAGEVIERPASVVKELLENSIDAGADDIEVEFTQGGQRKIEVRDNGRGIRAQQLPLAIRRHATSKIESAEDLEKIRTLGFRGEALASITSVARVRIVSRHREEAEARELIHEANGEVEVRPAARGEGTTVTVSNLFENLPARRKFMATESTEKKHIIRAVQRKILAHPGIHFTLEEDGMEILSVPPGDLSERVFEILGEKVASELLPVERLEADWQDRGRFGLTGLISNGEAVHHSRRHQFIFINSRPVTEPVIYRAISRAYRDIIVGNEQPVVVLFLDMPRDQLDVNVHPKKEEIRFNDSQSVFRFIYHTLRSELKDYYQEEANTELGAKTGGEEEKIDVLGPGHSPAKKETPETESTAGAETPELFSEENTGEKLPSSRLIGQFKETFLLVERDTGLLIIDQHTAHEKILFERYRRQVKRQDEPAQHLSVPMKLEVSPADREVLLDNAEELSRLGLTIEPFGGNTLVIQTVPGYLGRRSQDQRLIYDMIEDLIQWDAEGQISNVGEDMIAIMSCRSAVKRGDKLLPREQRELVEELNKLEFPARCPHGRPVYKEIENHEFADWFGRPPSEMEPR
ncbi:MAG: DNA mismatch repair endonuclease MutL [bacterium]